MSDDDALLPDVPSRDLPKDKRFGREISYGIQQTFACWATDFIDPVLGMWIQNKWGDKSHKATASHTFGGEFFGDTAALGVYLFSKRVLTAPVDWSIAVTKKICDPLLDWAGRRTLSQWREKHRVAEDDARYRRKLEMYKDFQAENIVDTGIIGSSSVVLNVATQRVLGNRQSYGIMLASKMAGALITMAGMLGLRTALPSATKTLDDELSARYFSPVIRFTKRLFGVDGEAQSVAEAVPPARPTLLADAPPVPHRLASDKRAGALSYLRRVYAAYPGMKPDAFAEQAKRLADAYVQVLHPGGGFARRLAQSHFEALQHWQNRAGIGDPSPDILYQSALVSIQSILLNRRDDMIALRRLLDEPEFRQELAQGLAAPPPARRAKLSPAKQEELVESLVQSKGPTGREPAVHIYANAKGQAAEHKALADCFDPNGAVAVALLSELQKAVVKSGGEKIPAAVVQEYLEDRRHAANLVVDALKLDGAVIDDAIHRSESIRLKGADLPYADRIGMLRTPSAAMQAGR